MDAPTHRRPRRLGPASGWAGAAIVALGVIGLAAVMLAPTSTTPENARAQPAAESPDWRPPTFGESFWDHWGDGAAELAAYQLRYPRYGQVRDGVAVAVFVTEDFALEPRVKSETPASRAGPGVVPVMKLNLMQDFPTGVYDYHLMTSVFVPVVEAMGRPAGTATKVSFSSQEWCGHVYSQMLFNRGQAELTSHSYFEGEADETATLRYPDAGALSEDTLWHWARGFAGPQLEPGQSVTAPLVRSLEVSRLRHVPVEWMSATLSRGDATERIETPAGTFEVERYEAVIESPATRRTYGSGVVPATERTRTFFVEAQPPHRLVRWTTSDGLQADLLGSERMPYWSMNGRRFEEAIQRIGLESAPLPKPAE